MGLHQWIQGSIPHVVLPSGDDVAHPTPPTLLNDQQPPPPWLDFAFLDRLDEINGLRDHAQRIAHIERAVNQPASEAIHSFAHEVRTPLATLHATLEILREDTSFDRKELSEMVRRLQRGVTWITELVDGLADSACACDSDQLMPLRTEPTSVCDWVDEAIALVRPIAERRSQSITLVCSNPIPVVCGDPLRLGQVVVNLLTNACRYGAEGDAIVVSVSPDDRWVAIRVTDHGIGITPDEQAYIFERHVRGTRASQQHRAGKGLGLAIARSIVEQHDGTIEVESAVDQGTTFTVRLPTMQSVRPLVLRRVMIEESEAAR